LISLARASYGLYYIKVKGEKLEEPELNPNIFGILLQILLFIPIFFWIRQYSFNYLVGNQYLKAGYVSLLYFHKPKQAIELFDRSAKLYPENSDLWYWKGIAYHIMKDQKNALKTFEKALTFSTNNLIYYQIGLIKKETGHSDEAVKYFKKSIDIIPRFISGYLQLGIYYQQKKNYALSSQYLEKIDEYRCRYSNPNEKNHAYLMLAQNYYNLNNYDKSLLYIEKYLTVANDNEKTGIFNMIEQLLRRQKKKPDEMADVFDKFDKSFPDKLYFDERMGAINFQAKRYKRSLYFWKKHLDDSSKKGSIYYNIAACYYYLKDFKNSKKYVEKSLLYEPEFKKSLELKAVLQNIHK